MSFLSPIWFFALAALSIPVLIHLWNIRPGKTLKVGSITLITEASKTTSHSLKLLDILLLILRCLLLALLAFFLAGPLWSYFSPDKKAEGWVLIPKENFKESYQKFKPQVDSLMKAGYEFHYFNKNFAKQDWKKLLADTAQRDTTKEANYWSLVKALDSKVHNLISVYIITPSSAIHFKGEKPQTNLNLSWKTYIPADSTSRWIATSWMGNSGEIKATLGNSTPSGTVFTTETVQADGNTSLAVNIQNGQPMVGLKNADQQPVAADTNTLRIAIYTAKYAVDAGYLKAALQAAISFNGRKASVKQYASSNQVPAGQTWLFWLSDAPIDNRILAGTVNILKYESGKTVDAHTRTNPGNIALTKYINAPANGDAIWQDGFGKAILSHEQKRNTNIYHFYTHFNPAWGDLVWNDAFPKQILELLNSGPNTIPAEYDKRVLSEKQLMPNNIINSFTPSSIAAADPKDISPYFWLLLILVFATERWLSHKTKATTHG
jgi:hypothetical protein